MCLGSKKYDFEFGGFGNFFCNLAWYCTLPTVCTDCDAKVIKYTIFNFPSLKGSTIVD
jgi:hypothetical protein